MVSALSSARVSVEAAGTRSGDVGLSLGTVFSQLVVASLLKELCGSGPLELYSSRAYRCSEWHWRACRRAGGRKGPIFREPGKIVRLNP